MMDIAAEIDEDDDASSRGVLIRPVLQKLGTAISFATGMIAFGGFSFAMVAGETSVEFRWSSFVLVMLPSLAAHCTLAQRRTSRKASVPILVVTSIEMTLIAGTFLREAPGVTVVIVSTLLFVGAIGLLAHLGVEPVQDSDVQLAVGLLGSWAVFAGSMAMFVFGHAAVLSPLIASALAVVILHILYDDPTALQRRLQPRQRAPRDTPT